MTYDLDDVHNILKKAMLAAPPETRPARPHFGGSLPVMTTKTQFGIVLDLVEEAARLFPPPDRAAFEAIRAAAWRVRDGERPPRKDLDAISKRSKKDAPAIRVAKHAVRTAGNFLYSPAGARTAVAACVDSAAVAIVESLDGETAAFLAWLDNLILCHHLEQQLADRELVPGARVATVMSRTPGVVFVRLADGTYGLYAKLRARWEWHEGDRASMFATVPDAHMAAVAADLEAAR